MSPRTHAVIILLKTIVQGKPLDDVALTKASPLTKEICYGALRFFFQLQAIALLLLENPIKKKDQDVFVLILIGIYQLRFLKIPSHAAINETVNACQELKKPWAKALVNALLRSYQRQKEFYLTEVAHFSHPAWLIEKIRHAWPNQWQNILEQNNQRSPLCLRVNQQKITRNDYLNLPSVRALHPQIVANSDSAIIIDAIAVEEIPGFSQGLISIQDASAQFAAPLLNLKPRQRVLDACAAPGGKTTHILEIAPEIELIAIDHDKRRLAKVASNLQRLNLSAQLIHQNACLVPQWWDGKPFDRILVDAPCSGSGVIRRHPDIKLLRRETDIAKFSTQQLTLLNQLWPLLKTNGLLLYVTCSILPAENDEVISRFCQKQTDAEVIPITKNIGIASTHGHGRQILSTTTLDGFYYCLLQKS